MSKSIQRESPLVRFELQRHAARSTRGDIGVRAWERAFCGHINLRGDPTSREFRAVTKAILGVALPLEPNTVARSEDRTVFWLGPNEWLIVVAEGSLTAIVSGLRRELDGMFFAVTEVSGGQTIVVLRGKNVRDLLAKGCPLDLHPRVFGSGHCAQSHLAKAPFLLHQVDDDPTFELVIRRSFADYLWLWLVDAADEFGLEVAEQPIHMSAPHSGHDLLRAVNE